MLQNTSLPYTLVCPKVSEEYIKWMEEIFIFTPMLFSKKQHVKVVVLYCMSTIVFIPNLKQVMAAQYLSYRIRISQRV